MLKLVIRTGVTVTLSASLCVIWLCLILSAFALDDLGLYGRIIGTIIVALALWAPRLLTAVGWVVPSPAPAGGSLSAPGKTDREPALGGSRAWWRRPYILKQHQVILISGLGGAFIGCMMLVYLKQADVLSLGIFVGGFSVWGMMIAGTAPLLNKGHPHYDLFHASVRHATQLAFLILFAMGFWQHLPAALVVVLTGGLCALILFTLGPVWSFVGYLSSLLRSDAKANMASSFGGVWDRELD